MQRALQLGSSVHHAVSPNPMVGAVIVHQGKIIGEGFHACYGKEHAEVNAIRSVKEPQLLAQSTLYVTLEPCSHYGKTPPCAALIIEKKIPQVVVGCLDPFPQVAGRGITLLREAGIKVSIGVLEKECRQLNKRFIFFHTHQRPFIILKWAETQNGFIDTLRSSPEVPPLKLSSSLTQIRVHKMRSEVDAILVGTQTALLDNPSLTTRHWSGKSPLRIALDREGKIPGHYRLKDGEVPTLILTKKESQSHTNGLEYIPFDFATQSLPDLLHLLYQKNIHTLLVEGGSRLLQSFIDQNLWEEAVIETNPQLTIEQGIKAPSFAGEAVINKEVEFFGGHIFRHLYRPIPDL